MKLVVTEQSITHLKSVVAPDTSEGTIIWPAERSSCWYGNWCIGHGPWTAVGTNESPTHKPWGQYAGIGAYLAVATNDPVRSAEAGNVVILVQRGKLTHMGVLASPADHTNPARKRRGGDFTLYRWMKILAMRMRMPPSLDDLLANLDIEGRLPVQMPGGHYHRIDAMQALGKQRESFRQRMWEAFGFESGARIYVEVDDPGAMVGCGFPDSVDPLDHVVCVPCSLDDDE